MAEYTLSQINEAARTEPHEFITSCEQRYRTSILKTAETIAAGSKKNRIILINGPSSSGKTTTCNRLYQALEKFGIHAETISMDDYYRTIGTYEVPRDIENGVPDLESPECMDLALLQDHLTRLAAGEEIAVPRFDFEERRFYPEQRRLRLDEGEVCIIEGIHAFNPLIMGKLESQAVGIYLSVASTVTLENGTVLPPTSLRFLRRAIRDRNFRNSPVEETIRQWNSVRRGERLYIQPYIEQAKLRLDSFLPYEFCIFANELENELKTHEKLLIGTELEEIVNVLGKVEKIDFRGWMPEKSVLHEFVG